MRKGIYDNNHFQSSWNKHGEANFEYVVLERVSNLSFLTAYEQSYLDYYRTLKDSVYNQKGPCDNPCRGIKHTPEQNAAKSLRYTGSGNPMFGKIGYNNGKHLSDLTKQRISDKRISLKIKLSPKHQAAILKSKQKCIEGIHSITGEVIEFVSAKEAEKTGKFKATSIARCIQGKRNSHRNFHWQFLTYEENTSIET